MSVYKDLSRILTTDSFDAEHIANYLWRYRDGDLVSDITNTLYEEDKTSKTKEEFKEYMSKNYKKMLDEFDKAIKREVDKALKEGYRVTKDRLERYIKNY